MGKNNSKEVNWVSAKATHCFCLFFVVVLPLGGYLWLTCRCGIVLDRKLALWLPVQKDFVSIFSPVIMKVLID